MKCKGTLGMTIGLCILMACEKSEKNRKDQYMQADVTIEVISNRDTVAGSSSAKVLVTAGDYFPLYGKDSITVHVSNLLIDVHPVTNIRYLEYVQKNKRWRKSQLKSIYGDKNYLSKWPNDTTLPFNADSTSPVTNISWFAAKAYCECRGERLPTVDEWEYVAMANQELRDARALKSYNQYILDWYEKPNTNSMHVGSTFKNYWGVYDLHGLVWEWTMDFNSVMISGESRKDVTTDRLLYCGSGSEGANDLMNYAAFMRYAFRGSLKAKYSIQNLGFRCVKDTIITK